MYIGLHNHTDHSNYRLLDSINKIEGLIKYTKEVGHSGVAITDHETVGSHALALHLMADLKKAEPETWKDYKLILGNEIYLCDRKQIQEDKDYVFPHFILIAKNANGHKALRELSTRAWCENSFTWVNLRVPTFYDDLFTVMADYKGDVIASTACMGGTLPKLIYAAYTANPLTPDFTQAKMWINKMVKVFGAENFFLELQPSIQAEQDIINQYLIQLADELNLHYIITTDSHYLKKEDRPIHEAFLNSQDGDREVGDFYATTYVMSEEEIHQYLDKSLGVDAVNRGLNNTMLIYNMVEDYSLDKPLNIPYIPDDITEPNMDLVDKYKGDIPLLDVFAQSEYESDRHLTREIVNFINTHKEDFENKRAYDAIQECLEALKASSDTQHTPWSAYLLQTKELIKLCWESGTLVGPARGSGGGFVLLYILGIIQMNPLKEDVKTYAFRFLHKYRSSTLDIDTDIIGDYRDVVIENLQKKYGGYRHVAKVQTLSTSAAKKALQIACRGLGYTPEEGVFLGSFIKAERGIQFSLKQTYYGDESNGLAPNTEFVNLMNTQYGDVWKVALGIEGLVVGTGQHAGGVILTKEDMVDDIALMKTKSGDITTQFDLHTAESCSLIKWDILAIDALGKIKTTLQLLMDDHLIEWQGSWQATYDKYVGVYNIDRDNAEVWDMIDNHKILSLFQFEKTSGKQAIQLGKPRNLQAMAALNSVMRLMPPDPTAETPLQRYARFREDITLWYKEMEDYGLTPAEQEIVKKYAEKNYGLFANQEDFMIAVQDPALGGFDLVWADRLRKSIAKKSPKDYMQLQKEYYDKIEQNHLSSKLCHYVWDVLVSMNRGYGFNLAHTLGYSIVALQEANLAYHYPIVYWNTGVLTADSGGEDSTVRYDKIATAVSRISKEGINITPPYINEARFNFRPDAENNRIIYGLKPINGVGATQANAIVAHQPYTNMQDFQAKMTEAKGSQDDLTFGDTAMIQLIKAGAFDELENKPREEIMKDYIKSISKPVKSLTLKNIEDLNRLGLLTAEQKKNELRWYRYKNYVFTTPNVVKKVGKSPNTWFYKLDHKFAEPYFYEVFESDMTEGKDYEFTDEGFLSVKKGSFDKILDKKLEPFKEAVLNNPDNLAAVNEAKFQEVWDEKAAGTISQWEMSSLNFYVHEHELAHVDRKRYNIVNFDELGEDPEIADTYFYKGQAKPRYKLVRVAGTVIGKDNLHNTVSLLTPDGVVSVKFYSGQFSFYGREITQKDEEGVKHVLDKSWFKRGTKLLVTGFRSGDQFVPRKYNDSIYKHTVQLITDINPDGSLSLISDRINIEGEDGEDAVRI